MTHPLGTSSFRYRGAIRTAPFKISIGNFYGLEALAHICLWTTDSEQAMQNFEVVHAAVSVSA